MLLRQSGALSSDLQTRGEYIVQEISFALLRFLWSVLKCSSHQSAPELHARHQSRTHGSSPYVIFAFDEWAGQEVVSTWTVKTMDAQKPRARPDSPFPNFSASASLRLLVLAERTWILWVGVPSVFGYFELGT